MRACAGILFVSKVVSKQQEIKVNSFFLPRHPSCWTFVTMKGKTDTNGYPFRELKRSLSVCYPFERLKKSVQSI